MLRSRRRPVYGPQACAVVSALLLLVSVSLLYTRLSLFSSNSHHHLRAKSNIEDNMGFFPDSLISDSEDDSTNSSNDDKIDEHDNPEDEQNDGANAVMNEEEENQEIEQEQETETDRKKLSSSGYYFDHFNGVIRRAFSKRSIEEWDYDYAGFTVGPGAEDYEEKSKAAFGSDDVPVDEEVRRKMSEVSGIEDALLLKVGKRVSPLRKGWGDWFDKKGEFLRRDRMFKSHLEILNPLNNPLLQDPDGVGVTGLTRGDRVVQKWLLNEFKRVPFMLKKPLSVPEVTHQANFQENVGGINVDKSGNDKRNPRSTEFKRTERKTLDKDVGNELNGKRANYKPGNLRLFRNRDLSNESERSNVMQNEVRRNRMNNKKVNTGEENSSASAKGNLSHERSGIDEGEDSFVVEMGGFGGVKNVNSRAHENGYEFSGHIYADGKRWGYYPGLDPWLSFSDFMDVFFREGKCNMRIFMVWNSPSWMYSVRHQRGLESLLAHHQDACVVMFSETIELDFFKDSFVKDGYKVAVAMPNLDELLKDTPTHVFASVWFEWRKTKFYATHFSELVRLAALYKYGGVYLDSDIIVLGSLSSLNNSVGMEDQLPGGSLNGAVMAFGQHSPFIMECLKEYYLTYDDTRLRWNGAELLTRVAQSLNKRNMFIQQRELEVQQPFIFFPVSYQHITSYFTTPATGIEKARQDDLFKKIVNESLTFHFWNSLTSALTPEPESLVARLIDHSCIHCFDVL